MVQHQVGMEFQSGVEGTIALLRPRPGQEVRKS